ncbi:MAG TPA: sigma factor [Luteolibacter sp.]
METQTASARLKADIGRVPVIFMRPKHSPMEERPSFREVFAAEESPLLRYAHGLVGQRETAEDLVQDAFLKLHAHWDEVIHPRAWLFRCIRNLALSHIRDH